MPETRLSDMIVPTEFNDYVEQLTTERSAFIQSGIMVDLTPVIDDQLAGTTVEMPFFNDLDTDDEDVVIDDNTDLTVDGVGTSKDVAAKLLRAKAFGASDLSGDLAGADPVAFIASRFADYWVRRQQRILFAALQGALGAASTDGNRHDISALTGGAEHFDVDAFVDGVYKLGDAAGGLTALAVHSATMKSMVKADLIEHVPDSEGKLTIPTYLGKRVIVDDGMPRSGTGAGTVYTTYVFGPGAVGYGTRAPKVPVEVERQALKGMGQEYIVQRKQWVVHPRGIRWTGVPAKSTPSNTELANPANWVRAYETKNIRILALRHKNAP